MTSNIGADIIHANYDAFIPGTEEATKEKTVMELKEYLKREIRPEFLNRIDETVLFTPLTENDVLDIVEIQLNQLKDQLAVNNIKIVVKQDALNWIAETGYDPHFGARPVKRVIQRSILNELSKQILGQTIDTTKNVVIDLIDDQIIFRKPISEEEEV